MAVKHVVLPVKSLADAQREIERLARLLEAVSGTPANPVGAAGGVLSGTYPDPGFAVDMATQAELNAAIAAIPPVDLSPYRTAAAEDVINNAETAARTAADTAEAAARTSGDAAVQAFAIQRANHTGTQTAATISDFNSASRAQTEAELVAGTGIAITPSGSGPTRQLLLDATGSSTAGETFKVWDVDKPPATPHALDLEFAGSNTIAAMPATWTPTAVGAFDNTVFPAVEPGRLAFKNTTGRGYYAALPAGDFNFAMHCGSYGINAALALCGIAVAAANALGSQYYAISAGYAAVAAGEWNVFTDLNNGTFTSLGRDEAIQKGVVIWIRRVGTALTAGWSIDGRVGPELTSVTPAWAPAFLHIHGNTTQNDYSFIKWVRFTQVSGTRQVWGGFRQIGTGSVDSISPDTPPTVPNAADDEWTGASLDTTGVRRPGATLWAWDNQGSATATLRRGRLTLACIGDGSGSYKTHNIYQALPAGDWVYEVEFTISGLGGSFTGVGLSLRESGTDKRINLIKGIDAGALRIQARRLTSATGWTANPYNSTSDEAINGRRMYGEIKRVGTTITMSLGDEGSYYLSRYSYVQTAEFTTAPNQIGLSVGPSNGELAVLTSGWWRRTA